MSKSHKDQRAHRRKVAGAPKGLTEHLKRDKRRHRDRYAKPPTESIGETGPAMRTAESIDGARKPR